MFHSIQDFLKILLKKTQQHKLRRFDRLPPGWFCGERFGHSSQLCDRMIEFHSVSDKVLQANIMSLTSNRWLHHNGGLVTGPKEKKWFNYLFIAHKDVSYPIGATVCLKDKNWALRGSYLWVMTLKSVWICCSIQYVRMDSLRFQWLGIALRLFKGSRCLHVGFEKMDVKSIC